MTPEQQAHLDRLGRAYEDSCRTVEALTKNDEQLSVENRELRARITSLEAALAEREKQAAGVLLYGFVDSRTGKQVSWGDVRDYLDCLEDEFRQGDKKVVAGWTDKADADESGWSVWSKDDKGNCTHALFYNTSDNAQQSAEAYSDFLNSRSPVHVERDRLREENELLKERAKSYASANAFLDQITSVRHEMDDPNHQANPAPCGKCGRHATPLEREMLCDECGFQLDCTATVMVFGKGEDGKDEPKFIKVPQIVKDDCDGGSGG